MRYAVLIFILLIFIFQNTMLGYPSKQGIVCGIVYDQQTGTAIEGANVMIQNTLLGTATDPTGKFSITNLILGKHTLEVRVMGYRALVQEIKCQQRIPVFIRCPLQQTAVAMPTLEVTAEKDVGSTLNDRLNVDKKVMSSEIIRQAPGAMEDVSKAMLKYPSVTQRTDASAFLNIRGGSPDQNLILLNGTKIMNPYAMRLVLGGGTSIFPADMIDAGELMLGGFSAKYGNRLSGVLNVRYRDGDRRGFRVRSEASLMSARLNGEGPLSNGRGGWIASVGRTYYEVISGWLGFNSFILPTVSNLHGRLVYDITPNHKLAINLFWNDERTDLKRHQQESVDLMNKTKSGLVSLNHRMVLSKSLAFSTTISGYADKNLLKFFDAGNMFFGGRLNFDMDNFQLTEEIDFSPLDWYVITFGGEGEQQKMDFLWGLRWRSLVDYPDGVRFNSTYRYAAAFMEHTLKPTNFFETTFGLRRNFYLHSKTAPTWSPRFQLRVSPQPAIAFKLSAGIFHQYPTVFSTLLRGGPVNFTEMADTLTTERADHFSAGIELRVLPFLKLTVDAYHKQFCNVLVTEGYSMTQIHGNGYGFAQGVEIGFEKNIGTKDWWGFYAGYAYGKAMYRLSSSHPWRFFDYDRRHSISLQGQLRPHRNLRLDVSWRYGSGFPYTPIIGTIYDPESIRTNDQGWGFVYGQRNSCRYYDYHRMDVRLTYQKNLGNGHLRLYLDITNVYNRQNIFIYDWDIVGTENGASLLKTPFYMMPFVPSMGVSLEL